MSPSLFSQDFGQRASGLYPNSPLRKVTEGSLHVSIPGPWRLSITPEPDLGPDAVCSSNAAHPLRETIQMHEVPSVSKQPMDI